MLCGTGGYLSEKSSYGAGVGGVYSSNYGCYYTNMDYLTPGIQSHSALNVPATMQSNSHGLGLGSYSVPNSHLPPIKPGGVAGSALTSSAPHSSPDLECGGGVGESPVTGYSDKSPNTWKYQSFQVL